jgi:lysophospholipase L1-like esterase
MARVLAFGDSLTWGYIPESGGRYGPENRWPEVLEAALDGITVITEGLNGRTTAYDDWTGPADRNGARLLPTLLRSHAPLDLTIVMLGTNDICRGFGAVQAIRGLRRLVEIVRFHPSGTEKISREVLLVAPPPIRSGFDPDVTEPLSAESRALPGRIRRLAEECGTAFFDAGPVGTVSEVDGVHFGPDLSRDLGLALAGPVAELLGLAPGGGT